MKLSKKIIALTAAALAVCMMLASCSSQREETGVADEKNMKISTAADLEGKAVAVQLRSAADEYVTDNGLTAYPKRYADLHQAVQDLVDKKVAAVVTDANYAAALTDGVEGVTVVKKSIGSVDYRFLFKKSEQKLAARMNSQIAALRESEEYQPMIESELTKGVSYEIAKDDGKELKGTVTLIAEPSFEPFIYRGDDAVKGLFAAAADAVAYGCGWNLDVKTVEAVSFDDTSSATDKVTNFKSNEAATVNGSEKSFCVVNSEATEDDTEFVTTDSFYTSQLVMIIRAAEKK